MRATFRVEVRRFLLTGIVPLFLIGAGCLSQPVEEQAGTAPEDADTGACVSVVFHPRITAEAADDGHTAWPVTFGVPFPRDLLRDPARVRVYSARGDLLPVQAAVTGTWPDGSIRWVLVDTQLPLGATPETYRVGWSDETPAAPVPADPVQVRETGDALILDTGPLRLTLSKTDLRIFRSVERRDRDRGWVAVFPAGSAGEIRLEDQDGTLYLGSLAPAPEIAIEEAGPMRATVKVEGWTQAEDGRRLGRHIVRVQAFAGQPWVRVYHTFVKTADSEETQYRNIALHVPFEGATARYHGETGPEDAPVHAAPVRLLQYRHDRHEIVSGAGRTEGGRSSGRVTVGEGPSSFTLAARHFWQNFPKEIDVVPGEVRFHVWPRHGRPAEHVGNRLTIENLGFLWWVHEGELLDFQTPAEVAEFPGSYMNAAMGANALGIAKTHELALYFHGAKPPSTALLDAFEAGAMAVPDSVWMADSGAFFDIAARDGHYAELEDALERTLLFLPAMMERIGDYGMWNFGAYHQSYHPSLEYAEIHRHWKGFHHGGPRWPWLAYVRSGNPEVYDFAEAHSRHLMDVAVCNWEDEEYNRRHWRDEGWWGGNSALKYRGGLRRYKGLVHWYSGMRMFYNSQVDFALWYYHLTGYRRARDVAMDMGEFLLRARDRFEDPTAGRTFSGRGGTGRGAMAITLYHDTHDDRFLELAQEQMRHFMAADDRDPDRGYENLYYAPFVERYWETVQDPALAPYIERWARKRLDEGRTWLGRDPFYNLMALGYQLTGDAEFLRFGLAQARELLHNRAVGVDPLLEGTLPTHFAGQVGYTAQQWGSFLSALNEHARATGERLALPASAAPLPLVFPFWSVPFSIDGQEPAPHRLVFHVRKEEGAPVRVLFSFGVEGADELLAEVTPPDSDAASPGTVRVEDGRAVFSFELGAAAPSGDYRVAFRSADGQARMSASWPISGEHAGLVVELPFWLRGGACGFWFRPTPSETGAPGQMRLVTRVRDNRYITHRFFAPDLQWAQTEQGRVNGPLDAVIPIPGTHRNRLWLYRQGSLRSGDGAFLSGDILPVAAFDPNHFFVPARFLAAARDADAVGN